MCKSYSKSSFWTNGSRCSRKNVKKKKKTLPPLCNRSSLISADSIIFYARGNKLKEADRWSATSQQNRAGEPEKLAAMAFGASVALRPTQLYLCLINAKIYSAFLTIFTFKIHFF